MSGKMSRNKGQRGERELCSMLSDELGAVVKRNLSQTRAGGADCVEIPGWSIEIKYQEKLSLISWWQQTLDQCNDGEKPILFYRQSRKPWLAMFRLSDIAKEYDNKPDVVTVTFKSACMFIRESL